VDTGSTGGERLAGADDDVDDDDDDDDADDDADDDDADGTDDDVGAVGGGGAVDDIPVNAGVVVDIDGDACSNVDGSGADGGDGTDTDVGDKEDDGDTDDDVDDDVDVVSDDDDDSGTIDDDDRDGESTDDSVVDDVDDDAGDDSGKADVTVGGGGVQAVCGIPAGFCTDGAGCGGGSSALVICRGTGQYVPIRRRCTDPALREMDVISPRSLGSFQNLGVGSPHFSRIRTIWPPTLICEVPCVGAISTVADGPRRACARRCSHFDSEGLHLVSVMNIMSI
jgi:hypothetical protein